MRAIGARVVVAVMMAALTGCPAPETPPDPVSIREPKKPPKPPLERDDAAFRARWPMTADEAEVLLRDTDVFARESLGISGVSSPQFVAFNVLLDAPDASVRFLGLSLESKLPARLYALAARQVLSFASDPAREAELFRDETPVSFVTGCVGDDRPAEELAEAIERYRYGEGFRASRRRAYWDCAGQGALPRKLQPWPDGPTTEGDATILRGVEVVTVDGPDSGTIRLADGTSRPFVLAGVVGPADGKAAGRGARRLRTLLRRSPLEIRCRFPNAPDPLRIQVASADGDVALALLDDGVVAHVPGPDLTGDELHRFASAERIARKKRIGVWKQESR